MKKVLGILMLFLFTLPALFSTTAQLVSNRVTMPNGEQIFVSGMNVAWNRYSGDVGSVPLDKAWFQTMLEGIQNAGGNAIRWWLFTNAANAPTFDGDGYVDGPGSQTINNIRLVLDMAQDRGIVVSLCLLSFDLFQTSQQGVSEENNRRLMTTDLGIKRFIDNALLPVVSAIGSHPAILCWEIFNEPEGMTDDVIWAGWTPARVSITNVQTVINRTAGAIHRALPDVLVSNGSWAFIASTDVGADNFNYYSDDRLIAAGGDPDGILDFYMVHYYDWAGTIRSPFHNDASHWGLDKPLVIGEFSAKGFNSLGLTPEDCYRELYNRGYAGAMSWTYTNHDGHGGLPDAAPAMGYLRTNYPAAIDYDPWNGGTPPPPTPSPTPGIIKVQYRCKETNPTAGSLKPNFNVVNEGFTAVSLNGLTIRYYFTTEAPGTPQFNIEYAVLGNSNITGSFKEGYLEIGFLAGAGNLAAGGNSGNIEVRINKNDWSAFNQNNDYSFAPALSDFGDNPKVTLYNNGQLIWGTEPGGYPSPTPGLLRGDVNGNGTIDIVDALMTAQHYVGLNPSGFLPSAADVNNSGTIDIVDALMMAQFYVGLITSF